MTTQLVQSLAEWLWMAGPHFLLWSELCFLCAALICCFASSNARLASIVGAAGSIIGCVLGLLSATSMLSMGTSFTLNLPCTIPLASLHFKVDALSALFLILIDGLSLLFTLYGVSYLYEYRSKRSLGGPWCAFNLLVASMGVVVTSQNGVLFLIGWELMALSSFFLVMFEGDSNKGRDVGITYLIATHLGTLFLLVMFILMAVSSGSFEFDAFRTHQPSRTLLTTLFLCAVIGFGTKAGLMPFHVWLPEAHPAAPSHVSALMSGVMIKTGIYGILRLISLAGMPPLWWGWLLIGMGFVSAVGGVLFALAQHDLKKLLAYHSVENIGIIVLGIGLGVLGLGSGSPPLALTGFLGALLHVINHGIFKGLLFLGAGAIFRATGTRQLDELGGLLKKMPATGYCFLIGALAISGLPPLNGFVSEFLIYIGSFRGGIELAQPSNLFCFIIILGLTLIGGLACACFSKAFGIVFLGEPRQAVSSSHTLPPAMKWPMIILAGLCIAIGVFPVPIVRFLLPCASQIFPVQQPEVPFSAMTSTLNLLTHITATSLILLLLIFFIFRLRRLFLGNRKVTSEVTWDCGYAKPTPRMQYTASSFAQSILQLFQPFLPSHKALSRSLTYFPGSESISFSSHTPDHFQQSFYWPLFHWVDKRFSILRRFQHGKMQVYVLFIAAALIALLIWQLGAVQ
ncbi:MAG: hydrogenase [Deltaproteobacteria bacterium]|nr:hydrogenase [Deltaproteobacteria bacterium]